MTDTPVHRCPHCLRFNVEVVKFLPPPQKKRRVAPEQRVKRQRAKAKTGEHVTVAAIAQRINRSPRDCRAALRALNIPKPSHGWSWPPSEARVVEARLRRKFGMKVALVPLPGPANSDDELTHPARTRA